MAHGDKKWIKDYRGRYKKSNDRTKKDMRGKYVRTWWTHDCETCKAEAEELGVRTYRYDCETCRREHKLMWSKPILGVKSHYQWSIREDVHAYRNLVRHFMNREDYDNIPRYRRGWYD